MNSLCERCVFGLCLKQTAREIMWVPQTKEIPVPGPRQESWSEQETMEVEDNTSPPIGHEVSEEAIISMCYFHPEGTDPINRPIWSGREVTECSKFSQKDLPISDDKV